jgi:hypothetical protein
MKIYGLISNLHMGLITDIGLTKLRLQMDTVDWNTHEVKLIPWDEIGDDVPILHYGACYWPGPAPRIREPIMSFQTIYKADLISVVVVVEEPQHDRL